MRQEAFSRRADRDFSRALADWSADAALHERDSQARKVCRRRVNRYVLDLGTTMCNRTFNASIKSNVCALPRHAEDKQKDNLKLSLTIGDLINDFN